MKQQPLHPYYETPDHHCFRCGCVHENDDDYCDPCGEAVEREFEARLAEDYKARNGKHDYDGERDSAASVQGEIDIRDSRLTD